MHRSVWLALSLPALALSSPAQGQIPPRGDELEVNWPVDLTLTAVAGAAWAGTELAKGSLAPESCRWCATNSLDDSVTRALRWSDLRSASTFSDVLGYGVVPVLTVAGGVLASAWADGRLGETPTNALLVLEAVSVSGALTQAFKLSLGRERPFVAELPLSEKSKTSSPEDNNLSFYSGHADLAFALVVSVGTVAHLRGYRAEPYIWALGVPLATLVAYSRIAAEKHYLSDVIVGSIAGATAGFLVPFLHRRGPLFTSEDASLTVAPSASGLTICGTF